MTDRSDPLAQRLIDSVSDALDIYASTPPGDASVAGMLLTGYVRKGYLKADCAAGNEILHVLANDGDEATRLMYPFLRGVKVGQFSVDEDAIRAVFKGRDQR